MTHALLIPETTSEPIVEVDLQGGLEELQALVGGYIQALPVPYDLCKSETPVTAYVNEEGKFLEACKPNMRATDFMVPGVGLFFGDYISGPMLVCGFDPEEGVNLDIPQEAMERIRLIEREAGLQY